MTVTCDEEYEKRNKKWPQTRKQTEVLEIICIWFLCVLVGEDAKKIETFLSENSRGRKPKQKEHGRGNNKGLNDFRKA